MKFLTNEPSAPWWWKRAENASIVFFTGAIPIVALVGGIDPVLRDNITQVVLPLIVLSIKSIGMLMGDSAARPINPEQKQELRKVEEELQQKWTEEKQNGK